MTDFANISFAKPGRMPPAGTVVALVGEDLVLGPGARALGIETIVRRAASVGDFKGKSKAVLDLLAPAGTEFDRLILVGTGKADEIAEKDWISLGGAAMGALGKAKAATVIFERPDGRRLGRAPAAEFALGMKLRAYAFDKYRTGDNDTNGSRKEAAAITIWVADLAAIKATWSSRAAIADGVLMARDLVNEPANVLGPVEFAEQAKGLKKLGVEVEVLTEAEMQKLGMRALLGVAQGSPRPPRLVVMRWNGGNAKC
ncbi:hypothetical protein BH10PSE9_BH10PSE9_16720 [soil metagenome]